jgi:hypothetical protein
MAGLVPGIHALRCSQGVDARDKRGHDGRDSSASNVEKFTDQYVSTDFTLTFHNAVFRTRRVRNLLQFGTATNCASAS